MVPLPPPPPDKLSEDSHEEETDRRPAVDPIIVFVSGAAVNPDTAVTTKVAFAPTIDAESTAA
jgi:hypothetical protein